MSAEVVSSMRQLVQRILEGVHQEIAAGNAEPEEELYFRWKCDRFDYTEKGATDGGSTSDYIHRKSWIRASKELNEKLLTTQEFTNARELITAKFPEVPDPRQALYNFCQRLVSTCFESGGVPDAATIKRIEDRFVGDLQNSPVTFRSRVELQGITLESAIVTLGNSVVLRQTRQEDVEIPARVSMMGFLSNHHDRTNLPSAILDVELQADPQPTGILQRKVDQYVAILGLFGVGGVRALKYTLSSDSIIHLHPSGTLHSSPRHLARDILYIRKSDEDRLKRFCSALSVAIPTELYHSPGEIDSLTIAIKKRC